MLAVTFIDQLPSGFLVIFPSLSVLPVIPVHALPWQGTWKSESSTPLLAEIFHIEPSSPHPVSVWMSTTPVGRAVATEENCSADSEHSLG